ncbi:hypothetical protein CLCR_09137 [Cladophialophora carrionii]|uniref:Uncharacterized protein n=1 Tax=Cladophialophora carrionii TaxID=86049 RepID=A0A1C1CTA1_9EURO|nr:hypothetical protein CLCR_09137 [Cladophialophora carrionii]
MQHARYQDMYEIPIIISTPDCHPVPEGQRDMTASGSNGPEMHPSPPPPASCLPGSHHGPALTTSLVSEGTQTDLPDETSISDDSPTTQSHGNSPFARTPFGAWTDRFYHHHISTHHPGNNNNNTTSPAESSLAPPETDLPNRPMTPRADLYNGQTSANFGMTFGPRPSPLRRGCSKPSTSPNSYEDQKHRMMMNWLERRGTV